MKSKVYFIQEVVTKRIKVGFSAILLKKRLSSLRVGNSNEIEVLKVILGTRVLEAKIHQAFKHLRVSGEWFEEDQGLLEFIKSVPLDDNKTTLMLLRNLSKSTNPANLEEIKKDLRKETALNRLYAAKVKSKNGGYTEGLNLAIRIIEDVF